MTRIQCPTNGHIVLRDGRHGAQVGGDRPLRGQPRQEPQQLLLRDLLHAEPQVRPPREGAHRGVDLRVLHRHADRRKGYDEFYQRIMREVASSSAASQPRSRTWPALRRRGQADPPGGRHAGRQAARSRSTCHPSSGLEPGRRQSGRRFGISCSFDAGLSRSTQLDPVATTDRGRVRRRLRERPPRTSRLPWRKARRPRANIGRISSRKQMTSSRSRPRFTRSIARLRSATPCALQRHQLR